MDSFDEEVGKTLGEIVEGYRADCRWVALTVYTVLVGGAMVALRYLPGIPFFLIGLAALALIVRTRLREGAPGAAQGRALRPPPGTHPSAIGTHETERRHA